ncbi:AAA family ATPase [Streptomyces sp. NPDC093252]|uniref:AAA family ATPase n=1 Tax=Streptomyces sp. NPDC093252 TaxID=3154980 RepID=UPI003420D35D
MPTRILPAVSDADAVRSITTLLSQLPDAEPVGPVLDSTQLIDTLARLAAESVDELPEVVVVHERIGPVPALELIREVALRFPAVGVILITSDAGPGLFAAAMDSGARGLVALPLSYEELGARVQAVAQWSTGVRRHLGHGGADTFPGVGGTVVTVSGAKGGVGTTLTAVHLALAAQASGRSTCVVDMDLQTGDIAAYLDVQFRRSVVDLAAITDISPRVLADAVFRHDTGLALLLAPGEGERGEEVTDRATRQIVSALRSRYETVVLDCGSQMSGAGAAAVEMADTALLVTTPDVVAVRGAKRLVRLWERLQIRKAEETTVVVNRHTKSTEIQPALIQRITGTAVARTVVPAHFKELQAVVDAGRLHELDAKSTIKQALWTLAGELGLVQGTDGTPTGHRRGGARTRTRSRTDPSARPEPTTPRGGDRAALTFRRRKELGR